jgi:DNA-binding response OmpR family regulator
LLVEDNADLRGYLNRLLTADGWQVTAVPDVESALAAAATLPDLILSDIMLPGHSGLDLVRLVRQDEQLRAIPVVLLTARAGPESAVGGLAAGADDYVVKPFDPAELLARLQVHHLLARARDEARARAESRAGSLEVALQTNRRIGLAIGILMARHTLSAESAFDLLRKASNERNVKLRDIAEEVVLAGDLAP